MEKETTQLENGQVNEVKASGMIVTVGGVESVDYRHWRPSR